MFPKKAISIVYFAVCLSLFAKPVFASSNWESEGAVTISGNYSDNPTLRADITDPQSASSTAGSVRARIFRQEDNRQTTIEPRVTRNWYPDRELKDAEHTNYYLDINTSLSGRRSNWNLSLSGSDQGILTSEQTDSADFLQVDDTRRTLSARPSVSYNLSEKDSVGLNVGYTNVDFDKDINTRFDFDSTSASTFYQRTFTERQSLSLTAFISNFQSEALTPFLDPNNPPFTQLFVRKNETDGTSLSVGYTYKWSAITDISLSYGRQSSDLTSTIYPQNDPSQKFEFDSTFKSDTYKVTVKTASEIGNWLISASQNVVPSSSGTPSESVKVIIDFDRKLSDRLSGGIKGVWNQNKQTGPIQNEFQGKRKFWSTLINLNWTLGQGFSLSGRYTHKDKSGGDTGEATSNTVGLGIIYSFDI